MFLVYRRDGKYLTDPRTCTLLPHLVKQRIRDPGHCIRPAADPDARTWEISGRELLELIAPADPARSEFVIDVAPSRADASLFRMERVCGYSASDWTPMMLVLSALAEPPRPGNGQPVQRFLPNVQPAERVLTFLYARVGHERGTQAWGRVGNVNGALLWPHAWTFFLSRADGH
ncbi:MAG: hypothetical protein ACRD17_10015 [Terriglobales bacterium]